MMSQMTPTTRTWIPIAAYTGTIVAGLGAFLLIRSFGETLSAPAPEIGATVGVGTSTGKGHALFHVLLALAAVIALGRVLGKAFTWIGQPSVIGEIVAGILLGPSLLGRISPEAMQFLLPKDAAVFGATDAKTGAAGSVINLFEQPQLNHQTVLLGGVLAGESAALLKDFFSRRRLENREASR